MDSWVPPHSLFSFLQTKLDKKKIDENENQKKSKFDELRKNKRFKDDEKRSKKINSNKKPERSKDKLYVIKKIKSKSILSHENFALQIQKNFSQK